MRLIKLNFLTILIVFGLSFTINAQNRPSFNKNKDIIIAQFDSKPDPDDIHAQAALGSMLAHSDLAGVNIYGVAGAIGRQGGRFIDSDQLFDLVFGSSNWTDADANRNASVNRIKNKVKPILNSGGKVWVQEAGQSDITRDWCQALLNDGISANIIKNNVIVVQHSQWNMDQTTPADLNWVRSNTNFTKIADGNSGGNGTPNYRSRDKSFLTRAKNSPNAKAKALWVEADRVIQRHGHFPSHSSISTGGVDYSDCVENWWILNIGGKADNNSKFWDRYITNTTGSNPNPPTPCEDKVFEERNGVAAVEAEDFVSQSKTGKRRWYVLDGSNGGTPTPDPDPSHHNGASKGGYLEILPDTRVTHGDPLNGDNFSNDPGKHAIIDYKVKFSSAGKYFVWVRAYSSGSEDNGVHVGINGTWPDSGQRLQWCSGKNQWTWESKQRTNANHCGEAQRIFINVPSAGVHTISFSMREDGFEMDKFVLSKAYNKPNGNGPAAILADSDCGTPPPPPPPPSGAIAIPGNFQAENYTSKSGSVRTEDTPGSSGKNLGFIKNGDYTDYAVNVNGNGQYVVDVYASSNGAGGKLNIAENGNTVGSINIPTNGRWHDYKKYSATVSLPSGRKTLRLSFSGGSGFLYNIDRVVVTKSGQTSQQQTVTLTPVNDAFLQGNTRNNSDMVRVESNRRSGYLMFDLSSINGTITKADLKFTVFSDSGSGNVEVYKGNGNNWSETNLSNGNKPGKGAQLGSVNGSFEIGSTKTVALKTGQISGNRISMIIEALSGNDFAFASKENNSVAKPALVVTYTSNRSSIPTDLDTVKLYPNPVVDVINFEGDMSGNLVKVYNVLGVLMQETVLEEGQNTIDMSSMASGSYIINIFDEGRKITTKIVVKQ